MASPFNQNNEIEANIRSLLRDSPGNRHVPSPSRNNHHTRVINNSSNVFPAERQFMDPRNPRYQRPGHSMIDPRYNLPNAAYSIDNGRNGNYYPAVKPLMASGNYNYPFQQPANYHENSGGYNTNQHGNGPQRIVQVQGGRNKGGHMKNSPQKSRCNQQAASCSSAINDRDGGSKNKNQQDINSTLALFDDAKVRELEKERIFLLRKRSQKFPNAKFFCRLCDFHCFSYEDTKEHIETSAHVRRKDKMLAEKKLEDLPEPTENHLIALDRIVNDIYKTHGLTDAAMASRMKISTTLRDLVQKEMPVCTVDLYGSSLSGLGLKNADVNIDLVVTSEKVNPAITLKQLYLLLRDRNIFTALKSDFSAKVPAIYFEETENKLTCQVTVNCYRSCLTNKLLAIYSKMDPRVRQLGVALKYWAQICKVDRQEEGTLPSYCLGLLVVYFLQRCEPPILPVLSQTTGNGTENIADTNNLGDLKREATKWKSRNTMHLGELWLALLKFYTFEFDMNNTVVSIKNRDKLDRREKKWSSKKFCIEDPFVSKRNVARSMSNTRLFEYVYDTLRRSYFYFSTPLVKKTDKKNIKTIADNSSSKEHNSKNTSLSDNAKNRSDSCKKSSNNKHRHSSLTDSEKVHSDSSQTDTFHNEAKVTPTVGKGCVPDLCHISSNKLSEDKDMDTSHLLDISSASSASENSSVVKDISQKSSDDCVFLLEDKHNSSDVSCDLSQKFDALDVSNTASESSDGSVSSEFGSDEVTVGTEYVIETKNKEENTPRTEMNVNVHDDDDEDDDALLNGKYSFEFAEHNMTDGKGPAIICGICEKDGHLKSACPEETLPELIPLPDMKHHKAYLKLITDTLKQVPKDFAPSNKEYQEREYICKDLEHFIKEIYPLARLHLFGSSCNGFGFQHSDLDICVTFTDKPTPEDLDYTEIIETLCKKLKKHPSLYNVFPIPTAKVPIVKFKHRESQLEGDISLYNTLAQQNTRLMKAYSLIDPRVRILGYSVKVFAKICDIGDASRGSLSSYAFILLVIHYLQQCKPPVIPVLQELHEGGKPEFIIDGWNAWFYEDLKKLSSKWSDFGKNNESIGELWVGFFRYYTEVFNYKDQVVCIRQKAPLSRFEKFWNGSCIAIEDPFDLNHNLGAGLSRKMNIYIMKAIHNGRNLYGVPISAIPPTYHTPGDYFFDSDKLTDGTPPTDRCCKACGKIGHIAKECPVVISRKEREMREKRIRDEKHVQQVHNPSPKKGISKTIRSLSDGTSAPENEGPSLARRSMSVPEDKTNNATTAADRNRNSHALPPDTVHSSKTSAKVDTIAHSISKSAQQFITVPPPSNTYKPVSHLIPLSLDQSNYLSSIMNQQKQDQISGTSFPTNQPNTSVGYVPYVPVYLNPPGFCAPEVMRVQRSVPLVTTCPQVSPHFTISPTVSAQNSPSMTSELSGMFSQGVTHCRTSLPYDHKTGQPFIAVQPSVQRSTHGINHDVSCSTLAQTTTVMSSSDNFPLVSSVTHEKESPLNKQQHPGLTNCAPVKLSNTIVPTTNISVSPNQQGHSVSFEQPLTTCITQKSGQSPFYSASVESHPNYSSVAISSDEASQRRF